jgi:hypothetical protein
MKYPSKINLPLRNTAGFWECCIQFASQVQCLPFLAALLVGVIDNWLPCSGRFREPTKEGFTLFSQALNGRKEICDGFSPMVFTTFGFDFNSVFPIQNGSDE